MSHPVHATDTHIENIPVSKRHHSGFEPIAKRVGSVFFLPSLQVAEHFDNNIYARETQKQSDWVTTVTPRITARTIDKHKGFAATLFTHQGFYAAQSNENFRDYGVSLQPYLNISRALKTKMHLDWKRLHEMRTDEGAAFNQTGREPVQYQQSTARIWWQYKPSRAAMSFFAQTRSLRYENVDVFGGGAQAVNNDRDRLEHSIGLRLSYDLSPQSTLFWKNKAFVHEYDRRDFSTVAGDYSGFDRDSKGGLSVIGMRFPVSHLISARIQAGFHHQDFDDRDLKTVTTPVGKAGLTWQATPLTTVYANTEKRVFETRNRNASSFSQFRYHAGVAHELRRNVILDASAEQGTNTYFNDNREDDYRAAGFGGTYKMNRFVSWRASYLYEERDSNVADNDFKKHRVYVSAQVNF